MNTPDARPVLTGEQALGMESHFSHVVVLPYSSRLVPEAGSLRTELSWPSEIALHAGVIALNKHDGAKLVIIGEDAHKGLDSTTDLTIERATAAYGVGQDSLCPVYRLSNGKLLNNTYRQIAGAAQGLVTTKSPNTLVVAFNAHLQRVVQISQGVNLLAHFVSVEDILTSADIHTYDDLLPIIAGIGRTERIKRIIGQKRGVLLNVLSDMGLVGAGYLDVDEATSTLVEKSARKYREQFEGKLSVIGPHVTE